MITLCSIPVLKKSEKVKVKIEGREPKYPSLSALGIGFCHFPLFEVLAYPLRQLLQSYPSFGTPSDPPFLRINQGQLKTVLKIIIFYFRDF